MLQDRRERQDLKLDYADVLTEIARLAAQDHDYARAYWFDERAAAVRDCTSVRVLPHRGCPSGGGAASPISCHVRGEPDCERVRAAQLVAEYVGHARRAGSPKFVTLTHRNVPQGELSRGFADVGAAFVRLRRRAIFAGGACRAVWPNRGPGGEPDGAPMHPCHVPVPDTTCHRPQCAPGCPVGSVPYGEHASDCDRGCPTRTGLRQSHCRVHPPKVTHPDGCPPSCPHAGHRRDRNCPDFRHGAIDGGISAIDLTFNEAEATWHPHLHALVDSPYILWAELSAAWRDLTCTTAGCRHERLLDGAPDPACSGAWMVWIAAVPIDDEERLVGSVREVLKYVAKPHGIIDSLDPARIEEYLWSLRGRRSVAGWGSFADASLQRRCPKACPPDCPKSARKWCAAHDCLGARRRRCSEHRPLPPDLIEIEQWFGRVLVPTHCPSCGAETGPADWSVAVSRPRLESFRASSGRYGWRPGPTTPKAGELMQ